MNDKHLQNSLHTKYTAMSITQLHLDMHIYPASVKLSSSFRSNKQSLNVIIISRVGYHWILRTSCQSPVTTGKQSELHTYLQANKSELIRYWLYTTLVYPPQCHLQPYCTLKVCNQRQPLFYHNIVILMKIVALFFKSTSFPLENCFHIGIDKHKRLNNKIVQLHIKL